GSAEYTEEPAAKARFQTSLSLPGCSTSLSLLGTGYTEKVFAVIGVKVYAAGIYVNPSILSTDALDEAISPRIKEATSVDKSVLSTFRSIFQGRPLKKGTPIFLTWLDPSKMLVCVSSDGTPSGLDATIASENVSSALFDVFSWRCSSFSFLENLSS
ncbi:hypothetical protein H0E87_000608, partial [Populus deltoides]